MPLEDNDPMLGLGRCLVAFQFQWRLSVAEKNWSSVAVQNQDADCIAGRIQEESVKQAQKLNQGSWREPGELANQTQEKAEVAGTVQKSLVSHTQEQG